MNTQSIPILQYAFSNSSHSNPRASSFNFEEFAAHLQLLYEKGYRTISMTEFEQAITQKKELPFAAIVLTFDDPSEEFYTYALPLLDHYGFKGTLYLSAIGIGTPGMLSVKQLHTLIQQGFELGTLGRENHNVTEIKPAELVVQLRHAIDRFKELLGITPLHFAYPQGAYNDSLFPFIFELFHSAVTLKPGFTKVPYEYARQCATGISTARFLYLLSPPRLTACLIVKNEEQFLSACLESIAPLVDEIIVVDTGSLDKTREIALAFTPKVFSFSWIDDFAAARNYSLLHATGDWVLVIDADEIITISDYSVIREALLNPNVDAYSIVTRNYTNNSTRSHFHLLESHGHPGNEFLGWYPSTKIRLFRHHQDFNFEGKVHETVERSIQNRHNKIAPLTIPIHHYGEKRVNPTKPLQYLQLGKTKISEEPTNARAYFELAMQYKELQDYGSAETALRKAMSLDPNPLEPAIELALLIQKQQRYNESIDLYKQIMGQIRHDSAKSHLLTEIYFGLAFSYYKLDDLNTAIQYFEQTLREQPSHIEACVNLGAMYEKQNKYGVAIAYLKKALLLAPRHPRAHYNLGLVYERQGNLGLALHNYLQAIALHYPRSPELHNKVNKIKDILATSHSVE